MVKTVYEGDLGFGYKVKKSQFSPRTKGAAFRMQIPQVAGLASMVQALQNAKIGDT